jgi:hypothetical protein
MTKNTGHIHRYKRVNIGDPRKKYKVYRCMVAACSHYVRPELAEGRLAECWRCREPFVLDKKAITLAKPHCSKCVQSTKTKTATDITRFLEQHADNE